MKKGTWGLVGALALGVMGVGAEWSDAAAINYGNFGPVAPGVNFLQVTESSGTDNVPLYGSPIPFGVGLDFNPQFTSTVSQGAADITDGQLNFTIDGSVGNALNSIDVIEVFEAGDYSLIGGGTSATEVFAGIILRATITELNGVSVAPIVLTAVSTTFSDSLPGAVLVQGWNLNVALNVQTALADLGYGPGVKATAIDVVINDTLASSSEANTAAFIAKKEFIVDVTTTPVPEPGTVAIIGLGGVALMIRRRRVC